METPIEKVVSDYPKRVNSLLEGFEDDIKPKADIVMPKSRLNGDMAEQFHVAQEDWLDIDEYWD